MTNEDRLRDLLGSAVPDAPPAPDRAAGARAYASSRRRRQQVVAGVAGALAVVLVALPVALIDRDRGDDPGPSQASDGPTTVGPGDVACPPPLTEGEQFSPMTGPDLLPPGPVAVRLCNPGGVDWQGPSDALLAGAAKVSAAVNALPVQRTGPDRVCTSDGGAPWSLLFQYADGATQVVRGATFGCGGIEVGSVTRGDRSTAAGPLDLFHQLLWKQRSTTTPPALPAPSLGCDRGGLGRGSTLMTRQDPVAMEKAVLCWDFETESEQPPRAAPISDADLATLLADLNANSTARGITEEECRVPGQPSYTIVGVNAWGDQFSLDGTCGAFNLQHDNSDIWRPNPASQAILDRLVAQNPQAIADPDAGTSPDQTVSIWADLVNAGESTRANVIWLDPPTVPRGVRVELKTDDQRRITPAAGSAAAAYAQVVEQGALYREQPLDGRFTEYQNYRFVLVRNTDAEPWRILSAEDLGVASTGR